MIGLLKIVLALLGSALLTNAQSQHYYNSYSHSYGTTTFGDVVVQTLNGKIYCDSMTCPQGSSHCRVTKRNDPSDFQKIIRHRTCLDGSGFVILEEKVNEPNTENRKVNLEVNSGKFGNSVNNRSELTAEEKRQLDEELRRTQQEIDEELRRTRQEIDEEMRRTRQEIDEEMRRSQHEIQTQFSRDMEQWQK